MSNELRDMLADLEELNREILTEVNDILTIQNNLNEEYDRCAEVQKDYFQAERRLETFEEETEKQRTALENASTDLEQSLYSVRDNLSELREELEERKVNLENLERQARELNEDIIEQYDYLDEISDVKTISQPIRKIRSNSQSCACARVHTCGKDDDSSFHPEDGGPTPWS
jgi:chromosome segregation ATPase